MKTLKRFVFVLMVAALANIANAIPPPQPITITLTPIADTYTQQGTPTINYGTASTVLVRRDAANSLNRNGYFEFDLSSLPAGDVVSAKLQLFGSQDQGGTGISIKAHGGTTAATWSETALNHSNQFTLTGVNFNGTPLATTSIAPPPAATYSWDVTGYVYQRRAYGNATIGLQSTTTDTYRSTFNSKEAATNKPQLVVTITPGVTRIDFTFAPVADTYTQQGMPTANFGAASTVLIRRDPANTLTRHGYFQFDLSSLPTNVVVTRAYLHLFGSQDQGGAGIDIKAHGGTTTSRWRETALTFNNAFSQTGVDFNGMPLAMRTVTPSQAFSYSWEVTLYIASRLSVGHATIGLDYTRTDLYRSTFNSKEAAANRPTLAVTVELRPGP